MLLSVLSSLFLDEFSFACDAFNGIVFIVGAVMIGIFFEMVGVELGAAEAEAEAAVAVVDLGISFALFVVIHVAVAPACFDSLEEAARDVLLASRRRRNTRMGR